jgi:integrase
VWAPRWLEALDVAEATESQYRCLVRNHILPRWGGSAVGDISGMDVQVWARQVRRAGYAESTVSTIVKILSMMLADAVEERLIPVNPIRARRRGRRRRERRREIVWATPQQVLRIGVNAAALCGTWAGLLIVTAGWTGARWGELCGLQRTDLHRDPDMATGGIVIDPDRGALHEVDGRLFLGPPKTPESARTITLPAFLVEMLARHLDSHQSQFVFLTSEGQHPRRSNFARRAMRPAADGTTHHARPRLRLAPAVPGLTFHGLRHSHKTWMIADGVPDVAQARRLGHILPDKIENVYSHVAPEVEARLLAGLQRRWTTAVQTLTLAAGEPSEHADQSATAPGPPWMADTATTQSTSTVLPAIPAAIAR